MNNRIYEIWNDEAREYECRIVLEYHEIDDDFSWYFIDDLGNMDYELTHNELSGSNPGWLNFIHDIREIMNNELGFQRVVDIEEDETDIIKDYTFWWKESY